jgi:hypothetical protein
LIAGFALWQVRRDGLEPMRSVALGVLLGAAVCAAILGRYNDLAFGSPFHIGYASEAGAFPELKTGFFGITYPKPDVMRELLFGEKRGLLLLAPALALAPVGWWIWFRRFDRAALVVSILIPVYYLCLNASYFYWDGGWSYGPRHMAPAIPFLAMAIGPLWAVASRALRLTLGVLCAVGVALTLIGVSVTAQPPITYDRPMAQLWWPAFKDGDLSVGHQSFDTFGWNPELVRNHREAHRAWNVGELIGLRGLASLLPLGVIWAGAGLFWRSRRVQ